MVVTHRVSFQIGNAFEQHSAEFSMAVSDLPESLAKELSTFDIMRILNSLVLIQGNLFQLAEGYIDEETAVKRSKRVYSLLPEKLQKTLAKICENQNGLQ